MNPYPITGAQLPIPFHRLLKVVAIVDRSNTQIRQLLEHITNHHFEVEVSENYDRDVSEDAEVGAYIALVDGDRLEPARRLARAVRAIGFRTPLWALADSHRISDMAVFDLTGEVDGYIYLGQQTPEYYAKQVLGSLVSYGTSLLPPFFGGLMTYDAESNIAFDCPGPPGRAVLPQVAGRAALLQALRREHLPQRPVQRRRRPGRPADPRRRRRPGAAPCRAGVRRGPDVLRAQRNEHVEQDRGERRAAPRRPGAVRPQQPQVAAPGRPGAGRRDSGLPADRAQPVRHDRRGRLGRVGTSSTCASRSASIRW
jgi:hypothetical protein